MVLNDDGAAAPGEVYKVHWAVFLPTVAIAVLYASLWVWFSLGQGASGGISRAALLVLAVGVPLLVVHAGLRYVNGQLELGEHELIASPGWPVRRQRHVTYDHVVDVKMRRGMIGRLIDVGTMVIIDRNGDRTVMPDLAVPQTAMKALQEKLGRERSAPA